MPAEPPPAEQDQHPADPGPHQVPQPLAQGRDPVARPAGQELQQEQAGDQSREADGGDRAGGHGHHRRTSAQPARIQIRMAALLRMCGPIRGLTRSVSDGCQGGELSRYAEASHSNSAATQITQNDIPVMSSLSGGGMRSGGRQEARPASTTPGMSTQISAVAENGAAAPAAQA